MSEPTTEPAAEPPPQAWPLVAVPAASAANTDSAVEMARVALTMLDDFTAYREQVRPLLEADEPAVGVDAVEYLADVRRSVSVVSDMIAASGLSATATINGQRAARLAERLAGLVVAAHAPADFASVANEWFGSMSYRVGKMAFPDDAEFATAVGLAADSGDCSFESVARLLGSDSLDFATRERRYVVARLAVSGMNAHEVADVLDIPTDAVDRIAAELGIEFRPDEEPARVVDTAGTVAAVLDFLDGVRPDLLAIGPEQVAAVDRDQAADWSRRLWDALKYVAHLRQSLDQHAQGRPPRPAPAPPRVVDTAGGETS